jgi:hypothetical protein
VLSALTHEDSSNVKKLIEAIGKKFPQDPIAKTRGILKVPFLTTPITDFGLDYLTMVRKLSDSQIKPWGLRSVGRFTKGRCHPHSIFIPIHHEGEVISWMTRSCVGVQKRRAMPQEEVYPAKSVLFGEDFCRNSVIICEGPFDCFRIGPGAIALMGSNASQEQLQRLGKYPLRVVCLDSDPVGRDASRRLCSELMAFPGGTYEARLDSKDPGKALDEEIQKLRQAAELEVANA